MRSSAILLEIIFFVTLNSVMLRPEKVFKHLQVVVLIYGFFEKVGSLDSSAGNPTSDLNLLVVQWLLNPINWSLFKPHYIILFVD